MKPSERIKEIFNEGNKPLELENEIRSSFLTTEGAILQYLDEEWENRIERKIRVETNEDIIKRMGVAGQKEL